MEVVLRKEVDRRVSPADYHGKREQGRALEEGEESRRRQKCRLKAISIYLACTPSEMGSINCATKNSCVLENIIRTTRKK